jgi:ATP-dependent helicase/nuclease subunit A
MSIESKREMDKMAINAPTLERDLTPALSQRKAADPSQSVWVSASAGSGKTKVLTDRILRLLLPRSENEPGSFPHKIMALTFTKAAANEMAIRLSRILSSWAILPLDGADEKNLTHALSDLLGRPPKPYEIKAARRLFAEVVDSPAGLHIMTIHAFCQSILGRFPLEAGLSPDFTVLEERETRLLLDQAKTEIFTKASHEKTSALAQALYGIAAEMNEEQFTGLLNDFCKERQQVSDLLKKFFGVDGLYGVICMNLNINPAKTEDDAISDFCQEIALKKNDLLSAAKILGGYTKTKTDIKVATVLSDFLIRHLDDQIKSIKTYMDLFLTSKDTIREKILSKKASEDHPEINELLYHEATRILDLLEIRRKIKSSRLTRDLFTLSAAIIEQFQTLKQQKSALDFDDLILKTLELLNAGSGWVMFKLDEGLDHILVDEAQDTNPEQWKIIAALCDEFFSGKGRSENKTRSIFVVGDEKQSIYSFQRAAPEEFAKMQNYFKEKITQSNQAFARENLNISFRSARSILKAVDLVFAQDDLRHDPGFTSIRHHAYHDTKPGLVELWPLFYPLEPENHNETQEGWALPLDIRESKTPALQCAEHIAQTIKSWLDRDEILASKNRPIAPGDILILVRTRNAFVNNLIRALKTRGIPVSGHDRMILTDQLAVEDLLALAEFSLCPADDLNLACVLKSPLIGLDEDALYMLAYNRPGSLWESLKVHPDFQAITAYLARFVDDARSQKPYDFFAAALFMPCPALAQSGFAAIKARLGGDAIDPLQELLTAALAFTHNNTPHLQNFLQWIKSGESEIKRDHQEGGNQIRIMTVHGSKGLEAPIVILPDTIRTLRHAPGQTDKRFLWPNKTGLDLPLWSPRSDIDFKEFLEARAQQDIRADQEYRRLLYVAMTRAQERLYITGYEGKKKSLEESWYHLIAKGLGDYEPDENEIRRIENMGQLPLANKPVLDVQNSTIIKEPEWLYKNPQAEPYPPRPLSPSRPSESDTPTLSPIGQAEKISRFRRGNLTHRLLQFLPDMPPDNRMKAAQQFLDRFAADIDHDLRQSIVSEIMTILEHPDFSHFFATGSIAEIPITGFLGDGRLVSGQIDRILITKDTIYIIDFKTNRPPPPDAASIPVLYKNQMQAYRDVIAAIYPEKVIKCALLWTDGPRLMRID